MKNRIERKEEGRPRTDGARAKRPYHSPRLVEYGHVAKLTQGGSGTKNEPGGKKACL